MIGAAAKGTAAAVTGLYISYHFDLPAGPAMTLVTSGILVPAASFRRRSPARESSSQPHDSSAPFAHDVAEVIDLLRELELPGI